MSKLALAPYRLRWQRLRSQAEQLWSGLALREKRLLAAMGLGLSGLLLWMLLIQPALARIDYWQTETPKLRAQAEALHVLLQEVASDARPTPDADLEPALRQALDSAGLKDRYQLQAPDAAAPGSWHLTFQEAPADAVVGWLLGSPRQFSLEVSEARLQRAGTAQAEDSAGTLSGTVRMDQALGAKEAS